MLFTPPQPAFILISSPHSFFLFLFFRRSGLQMVLLQSSSPTQYFVHLPSLDAGNTWYPGGFFNRTKTYGNTLDNLFSQVDLQIDFTGMKRFPRVLRAFSTRAAPNSAVTPIFGTKGTRSALSFCSSCCFVVNKDIVLTM